MILGQIKELVSEILADSKFDDRLILMIQEGQRDLERVSKIRALEYYPADGTLAADANTITIPADYIELIYLNLILDSNRQKFFDRVSHEEFSRIARGTTTTVNSGLPQNMRRKGDEFEFDTFADQEYTYEWGYYRHLTALTVEASTNWWTTDAPMALVYAALVQMIPILNEASTDKRYRQGVARFRVWGDRYIVEKEKLVALEAREHSSGVRTRVKYHDM